MSEVEISVWRAGREIDRVSRPLRLSPDGPAVTYRRRLWPVSEGTINLDGPVAETTTVETVCEAPEAQDTAQSSVIDAEADRRLLVDAGPGTGKTWTACARAASLIAQGAPPSRIWIISFTRTAVLEIRARIAAALDDPSEAASLKVSTLDAYAWSLQSGFDAAAVLTGSHDDNIERTLERVRSDEQLQDYLGRVRHLIVDEAQDIVGVRAELVEAIIAALPVQAGVTVFADPAQAIYGFTEEDRNTAGGPSLIDRLPRDFERMTLTRVRRTDCPKLRELFTRTRRRVLAGGAAAFRAAQVRDDLARLSHRTLEPARDGGLATMGDNGLVLFRRRAEVVAASSYGQDTPHRLRMSGLPVPLCPWLALLFWDWTDRRMGRADFLHLWDERLQTQGGDDRDRAWTRLVEAAGESADVIDLHRLRTLLSRAGPPLIFSTPEFGEEGPIVGTIHASKGREAEHVALWLPAPDDDGVDEEIRVLFVGGTRARTTLGVGQAAEVFGSSVQGRVWRRVNGGVQVEVGRAGDIEMEGLTGLAAFVDAQAALAAQALIVAGARQTGLLACADAALDWRLALQSSDRIRLAVLSDGLRRDLETISRDCGQWPPPNFLPHLRSIGLRSVAVRPDDPVINRLHEPWRSSGFATAPLLTGFSPARFRRKNG